MLTKIRVVTSLLLVLLMFGILQVVSGGVFFSALSNDKQSFTTSQLASENNSALSDAYMSLNQSRLVLTRSLLRIANSKLAEKDADIADLYQQSKEFQEKAATSYKRYLEIPNTPGQDGELVKRVNDSYNVYADVLSQMQAAMLANDIDQAGKLPVAPSQSAFQKLYTQWRADQARLMKLGVQENVDAFTRMVWILGAILALVALAIALCWIGLRKVLINPLNSNIQHIRHIAQGDLTQSIQVAGRNEMSELASNLYEMQQALVRTVSDVRDGSDAIFTGASEISAGNNDLSARTEQQAASLEQTAASMEQLTATVKQNAENARQASQLALSASETAQKGGNVVDG
ncbi:Tar ligand binding domain-containing protein, partial [Pantoea sp.]